MSSRSSESRLLLKNGRNSGTLPSLATAVKIRSVRSGCSAGWRDSAGSPGANSVFSPGTDLKDIFNHMKVALINAGEERTKSFTPLIAS